MTKIATRFLCKFLWVGFSILGISLVMVFAAFADVAEPTLTKVYFEKDDKPFDGSVDYSVKCYGYYSYPDDRENETPDTKHKTELVYSYSATCPSYECSIYENYYLNYKEIEYCDLEGKADSKPFKVGKFAKTPVPECKDLQQYYMYDGDHYYKRTAEYDACTEDDSVSIFDCDKLLEMIPDSEIQKDSNGNSLDRVCEAHFSIPSDEVKEKPFPDVEATHDDYYGIDYVKEKGIVNGYSDGTFKPDLEVNRAEFLKIIVGAVFDKDVIGKCVPEKSYKDVPAKEWYAPYVCVAGNNGIVTGYYNGVFKPMDPIKFVEAAKIVAKVYQSGDTVEATGQWYEPFVKFLQTKKAVPMSIGSLTKDVTRGEMAEMIYRIKENITHKESKDLLQDGVCNGCLQ